MQTQCSSSAKSDPHRRLTKQRKIILEELTKLTSHPTADELYQIVRQRIPKVSLGTIYRNLDFLVAQGQIAKVDVSGAQRRFDASTGYHQHVRCTKCGSVGDVFSSIKPPTLEGIVARGFTLTLSRVEFDGICNNCVSALK